MSSTHPLDLAAQMHPDAEQAPGVTPTQQTRPRTMEELGAALYGPPKAEAPAPAAPAATPAAPPAASTPEDLAERMYAKPEPLKIEVPPHIAEMRKADETAADRMFPDQAFPAIRDMFTAPAVANDMPAEARQAVAAELTRMTRDVGLTHEDVSELASSAQAFHDLTPEQATAHRSEATRLLVAEFGDDGAASAFDAARALATRDPRMAALLDRSGLGNSPALVLKLAREGMRQRAAGKLR